MFKYAIEASVIIVGILLSFYIEEVRTVNKNIEILWASTREAYNYIQAKQLKCNIITMPPKVINQISSFGKSYKDLTLDTIKGFLIDSKKSRFKI